MAGERGLGALAAPAESRLMSDALRWVYLANAVLLIPHEIDSAY